MDLDIKFIWSTLSADADIPADARVLDIEVDDRQVNEDGSLINNFEIPLFEVLQHSRLYIRGISSNRIVVADIVKNEIEHENNA